MLAIRLDLAHGTTRGYVVSNLSDRMINPLELDEEVCP
jgi:hypothetical protein